MYGRTCSQTHDLKQVVGPRSAGLRRFCQEAGGLFIPEDFLLIADDRDERRNLSWRGVLLESGEIGAYGFSARDGVVSFRLESVIVKRGYEICHRSRLTTEPQRAHAAGHVQEDPGDRYPFLER